MEQYGARLDATAITQTVRMYGHLLGLCPSHACIRPAQKRGAAERTPQGFESLRLTLYLTAQHTLLHITASVSTCLFPILPENALLTPAVGTQTPLCQL